MDVNESIKMCFKTEQWDKLSELEKAKYRDAYNMYHEYLLQGLVLPKPDFMISNEENDYKTANEEEKSVITFKEENLLPVHLDIDDDMCKEEITEICSSDMKNFESAVKTKDEYVYVCSACCLEFSSEEYWEKHIAKCLHRIPEKEGVLLCHFCDMYFTNRKYLEDHMKQCPDSLVNESQPLDTLDIDKRFTSTTREHHINYKGDDVKPVENAICNEDLSGNDNLNVLLRTGIGEEPLDRGNLLEKNSFSIEKRFKCSQRGYQMTYDSIFKEHIKMIRSKLKMHTRHAGEKPLQCTICNKKYRYKGALEVHLRNHSGEKPFQCKICNKKFTQSGHLKRHLKRHASEKPFECTICNQKYRHKRKLDVHLRSHTGEEPFQCTICNKEFTENCNLTTHLKHTY